MNDNKTITLTPEQLVVLYNYNWLDNDEKDIVKDYNGWTIIANEDTGEFDVEKSALVDYKINLYDSDDNFVGQAIGGCYTQSEHFFDKPLTFKKLNSKSDVDEFNNFLQEVMSETTTLNNKIIKVKDYIEKISVNQF
jgi:hypothetical protein